MTDKEELFNPYTYTGSESVEVAYGYGTIVFGTALFAAINHIVRRTGPPKHFSGDERRWRNIFVSWIHAFVMATGVLYSVIFKSEMYADPMLYCDYFIYFTVALSAGYFIYDLLDTEDWSGSANRAIVAHHLAVIFSSWYVIHHRIYVVYNIIGLLTEVNSVFLHGRKLVQLQNCPQDRWPYRAVIALNFLTFVFIRMGSVVYLVYILAIKWKLFPTTFKLFLTGVVAPAFVALNPIILWQLYKSDIVKRRRNVEKHNGVTQNGNGINTSCENQQ